MIDPDLIAEEFPLARGWTYLASAANGILPERSRRHLERYFREGHYLELARHYRMFDDLQAIREKAARLFGGPAAQWALQPNTSYGLNTVAAALPWEPGDSVVLADCEFPANVYPWKNLARRGVSIRWAQASDQRASVEILMEACDDSTRSISLSGVQFLNGYAPDLPRLAAFCRERDLWLCVDGIQGLGNRVWDLPALGVDFLAAGGQKWLCAPRGTGLLYFSERALSALRAGVLQQAFQGWLNWEDWKFSELLDYERPLTDETRLVEVGTYGFHDFVCLGHSLDLIEEVGLGNVAAHSDALREKLVAELEARGLADRFKPFAAADPPERRSQTTALLCDDPIGAWKKLAERRVAVNPREGSIRVSFHYYNTEDDLERLLAGLADC